MDNKNKMIDIKIAKLSKKDATGKTRLCNVVISQKNKGGDLFVTTKTGLNKDKLKSAIPKEFRYGHKAKAYFEATIESKKKLGFELLEVKQVINKLLSLDDISLPYFSYLSKRQFKTKVDSNETDLLLKPAPQGERLLIEVDTHAGVECRGLRKNSILLPTSITNQLINRLKQQEIKNCHLDVCFDGTALYIIDIIAHNHVLMGIDVQERQTWIEKHLKKGYSRTVKILPCFTLSEFHHNKVKDNRFDTMIIYLFKRQSSPVPVHAPAKKPETWITCIPKQIKLVVTDNKEGNISLGYNDNGIVKEYYTLPDINYEYDLLDVVSVAVCSETERPLQIIGKLVGADITDCIKPNLRTVKK